jgi:pSer/pThr/pTyr-binding forkhead associated (FHA) protein
VRLALRYCGHRCTAGSAIKPWYFAGSVELTAGQVFPIPPEGLVLGRGTAADVRVASNGVARNHVRLTWDDDGSLVAEDLGSTNGTQVNGVPRDKCRLAPGDALTLAGYFDFEIIEVAS